MMPEFIFKETGLSKEIVGFYPKTPKLVYFKNEQASTKIFQDSIELGEDISINVTDELDEGQIIEQDVARVDHTKTLENFISIGSCLLYTTPSPREVEENRIPSSA